MARVKQASTPTKSHPMRPAMSPEARESQLTSLAIDLAERQLREGTASSQVITHYLKLASNRDKDKLELERLEEENKLLRAKTKALENAAEVKALYEEALKAMRNYAGQGEPDEY